MPSDKDLTSCCTDDVWLSLEAQAALGAPIKPSLCAHTAMRMAALGFAAEADGRYVKAAQLFVDEELVSIDSEALPDVDAIAVLSIDRHNGVHPYLYDTLRSLYAELPAPICINVMVGNADDAYVAPDVLARELGEADAQRTYVHRTSAGTSHFLQTQQQSIARAAWNYGRTLRAYRGHRHLITFEDDIEMAQGARQVLNMHLKKPHPPLISLYNSGCGALPGAHPQRTGQLELICFAAASYYLFGRAQGVVLDATLAHALAPRMSVRTGELPLDSLIGKFMVEQGAMVGYVQPSMVQHMGWSTSVSSRFHQSACYKRQYPQP